jgi:hypothetical protein
MTTEMKRQYIEALRRARSALKELQKELGDADYPDGRMFEACETCERSLFNVLVLAHVYGWSDISVDELLAAD